MIVALPAGRFLSTSVPEAVARFDDGEWHLATPGDGITALLSFSLPQVAENPRAYQELACAIANGIAVVGWMTTAPSNATVSVPGPATRRRQAQPS